MLGGWPVARWMGSRYLGIDRNTETEAHAETRAAFDSVAELLADGRPYLGGDRFTAADLTFAALAAAVLLPSEHGIGAVPVDELDARTQALVDEFRELPAGRHAMRMYADERR